MRAIAVIPTYNERENLRELLDMIHEHFPDLHVPIVGDGSPDGPGAGRGSSFAFGAAGGASQSPARFRMRHRFQTTSAANQ